MLALIAKRCLAVVPLFLLLSLFTFALLKAIPGDPVDALLGNSIRDMPRHELKALRDEMGLNQPWTKQYVAWLSGWWGAGELGRSYRDGRPVMVVIGERLPATVILVGTALTLAFASGTAWGLFMALFRMRAHLHPFDALLKALAVFLYSAPGFWLAFLLVYFVVVAQVGLPVVGENYPNGLWLGLLLHLLLPATILAARRAAKVALFVRSLALDQLAREYVLVARSKGLSDYQVLVGHVLKNCLLPIVGLLGLSLPALLGGSVLIETIFSWPGMGRLAVEATFGRNYPVLLSLVIVYGALTIFASLLADIIYGLIDPRTREAHLREA